MGNVVADSIVDLDSALGCGQDVDKNEMQMPACTEMLQVTHVVLQVTYNTVVLQ